VDGREVASGGDDERGGQCPGWFGEGGVVGLDAQPGSVGALLDVVDRDGADAGEGWA